MQHILLCDCSDFPENMLTVWFRKTNRLCLLLEKSLGFGDGASTTLSDLSTTPIPFHKSVLSKCDAVTGLTTEPLEVNESDQRIKSQFSHGRQSRSLRVKGIVHSKVVIDSFIHTQVAPNVNVFLLLNTEQDTLKNVGKSSH